MADASSEENSYAVEVDVDPDFEPQKRPRSCTWPLPRPESNPGKPSEVGIIPEEEDGDENGIEARGSCDITDTSTAGHQSGATPLVEPSVAIRTKDTNGSPVSSQQAPTSGGLAPQQPRKSSARRNAWGNYSYADLITQAIESSPEKRLTLAQIYDWMVRNVPYFKDKGDSNSSAGWKVGRVLEMCSSVDTALLFAALKGTSDSVHAYCMH